MAVRISSLKKYWQRLPALLFAILMASPLCAAEQPPLQMGVLPYLSSERLFENFLPLKDYLEAKLKRRIVLSTAPDFKTYFQRAAHGDYDFYFTAPHFSLLAEKEYGHLRLSRFARDLNGDIVVRRDSPAQRIQDLRGRTVITPDALAIAAILGEQLLKENSLLPGKDYQLLHTTSHNNAMLTVYRRGADAALVGGVMFKQLAPNIAQELRVLSTTRTVPHIMAMAHPRLSAAEYEGLKSALLAFTSDGPGRKFFEVTGYGDMGPITDADMERLRPFLKITQERLK